MKLFITVSLLLVLSKAALSQSPGGVGTGNLRGWFDAGTGVTLTSGAVSNWTDRSTVGNASQGTAGNRPTVSTATLNYNDALRFDGVNDFLNIADRMLNTSTGVSAYAVARLIATTNDTWGSIINGQANGPSWTGGGYGLVALNSGNTLQGFYVRDYNTRGVSFSATAGVPFLTSGNWNGTTANNIEAFRNGSSAGTIAYTPGSVGDAGSSWIGSGDGANGNYCFYGDIAEIAVFNTGLSSANNNRVLSYLAIKYGITLGADYTNSAGTSIYTRTGAYSNNIIGLARDDGSGLTQKQSRNVDDSTRIYLSTLAASNSANGGSFSANLSHVMLGADNGNLCATNSTTAEIPSGLGIVKRIGREWKVTNTNFDGTFSMDFKLASCAVLGSINVSQLRLLIDDDGNFAAGTTSAIASGSSGITISYSNPIVTIAGISTSLIASGATRYLTIGSISGATPLPVKLKTFTAVRAGNTNLVEWTSASEVNFSHYELERSLNGLDFTSIAKVTPGSPEGLGSLKYSFNDAQQSYPIVYYRLKMVDVDGSVEYSKIVALGNVATHDKLNIFPNPSNDGIYITGSNLTSSLLTVNVSSFTGETVYVQKLNLPAPGEDSSGQYISLAKQPAGIYIVSIFANNTLYYTGKLVLIH